jgi:hypothetical protein
MNKDDTGYDDLAVPQELQKTIKGWLESYKMAEKGSFRERQCLDELLTAVWQIDSFAARSQWRDILSGLENGKSIPKTRFDEEARRRRLEAQAALKKSEVTEKRKPNIAPVAFKKFSNGVMIEQVLQGGDVKFALFISQDQGIGYVDHLPDEESGLVYVPYDDELIGKGAVWLPERAEEYEDTLTLLHEIQEFIHDYVEIEAIYERLSSYYVLFTWVYDAFFNLPYLRALGDTGSGKTRLITTVGALCYKPCFMAGAITPAPIYRAIDIYGGTLVLDEADFKDSEMYAEIVKILNVGFQRDYPVIRMQQELKGFKHRAFGVFCPKLIATRERFKDDALESRCITVVMRPCRRRDIPILLSHEFAERAREIRNMLLMFRFRNLAETRPNLTLINETLEPRLNQVLVPLASIIPEQEFREEFSDLMEQYQREIVTDRTTKWEAEVVEALWEMWRNESRKKCRMKEIALRVNAKRDQEDEKMTSHRAGYIVRQKLYLSTFKERGVYVLYLEDNQDAIEGLARRYGIPIDSNLS